MSAGSAAEFRGPGPVRVDWGALSGAQRRHLLERVSAGRPSVTGAELVAWTLKRLGFEWIAGIAGTPVDGIFEAGARHGLRLLGTRSQAGAVMMTTAAAFVSGRQAGVVVVSAGPAVTNALTGILVARDNGWPLLVLGGRRSLKGEGSGFFQELDAVPLMRPITKWSACVEDASAIPERLREAVEVAWSGRPGPVYLDLPEDVLLSKAPVPAELAPVSPVPVPVSEADVDEVAARLRAARRPVLVVGDGVRWRVEPDALRRWVREGALPVVALPLVRGLIPESDPLVVRGGRARAAVLGEADLVLVVGAGVDWRLRFGAEFGRSGEVVVVADTAADAARTGGSGRGIAADPGVFLQRLTGCPWGPGEERERWAARVRELAAAPASPDSREVPAAGRLSLQQVFETIREIAPPDTFLVLDGNLSLVAGQRLLPRNEPFLHLDPGWNGCMGTGIPFGLAARLVHPRRPVWVVTGDYAFGLGAIELETAARHGLDLVVVVVNNDGNTGGHRQAQQLPAGHPERVHAYQPGLAYERVAEGLGVPGCSAGNPGELRGALERALARGGSFLINALTDPWSQPPEG